MFIKHGDGKIVTVIDEEELTDKQKKSVKDSSKKQSDSDSDSSSNEKQSGR